MATKEKDPGLFDMDRLARVFTWFIGALVIFVLGMVFMQAINADTTTTTTTTTSAAATTTAQ